MGSKTITYVPKGGVCSKEMRISVTDGVIDRVEIFGGCMGNTTAVSRLVEGLTAADAIGRLKGIDCKGRGSSCPDQLAVALEQFEPQ